MIVLSMIVCTYAGMINDGVYQVRGCHPVQIVADEEVSLFSCFVSAQIQMAKWKQEHPDTARRRHIIERYTCEPADRVKADL